MATNQDLVVSTLAELDAEVGNYLLEIMRLADKRVTVRGDSIWNEDRIVFTVAQDRATVFQNYMTKAKKQDVTFPLLAFSPGKTIDPINHGLGANVNTPGIQVTLDKGIRTLAKAKPIETTYSVSVWSDDFSTIRYLQNNLIIRCIDSKLTHTYKSNILNGEELRLSSLIYSPSLNVLPSMKDVTEGTGFIYALGFDFKIWAPLADTPDKVNIIKQVNLDIYTDGDNKPVQKVITEKP